MVAVMFYNIFIGLHDSLVTGNCEEKRAALDVSGRELEWISRLVCLVIPTESTALVWRYRLEGGIDNRTRGIDS